MNLEDINRFLILRFLRKIYFFLDKRSAYRMIDIGKPGSYKPLCDRNIENVSNLIYDMLQTDKPCMIARFGNTEMSVLANQYEIQLGNQDGIRGVLDYIQGKRVGWWIDKGWWTNIQNLSGFYPVTQENIIRFYNLMLEDMKEVDILASWIKSEQYFDEYLEFSYKIALMFEQLYIAEHPWTKALEGKKVLIIHPFTSTIKKQYEKRQFIWKNQDTLPDFDLQVVKAVQSIGNNHSAFSSWFDALDFMKAEIEIHDFDICLLGCGAYGFPLAAHVKRLGKKAVHIGGALQLLFGIKGRRWDREFSSIYNDAWVRSEENEKPRNANSVEGGCYW